jgi:Phospholipase C
MKKLIYLVTVCLMLGSCSPASPILSSVQPASIVIAAAAPTQPPVAAQQSIAVTTATAAPQVAPVVKVPGFDHIVLIMLENEYLQDVIGDAQMPHLNALAKQNVLLSNYFAIGHPSLPNYLALVSGSSQNIASDCLNCFVNQPNLADEIEASGRTWKSYQESLPSPCFVGNAGHYAQWMNPFIYFDSIRLDATRCDRSIVPLTQLDKDLAANQLPNFSLIMPNLCDSGHSCVAETSDNWLNAMVAKLQASPALGQNSLIIITFDEGVQDNTATCCGKTTKTKGQIPAVLISPLARQGFNDPAIYSHYNLLKTILAAWNLPGLGQTAQDYVEPIVAPWNTQHQ